MVEFVVRNYKNLKNDYVSYQICQYIAVQNVMFKSNSLDEEMANKIRKFVKENYKYTFRFKLNFRKKSTSICI